VANLTVVATEKVVRARLDADEQKRLIDDALSGVDFAALVPEGEE
jgi:F0F1-type ATP synthase membrane subunit b/b'